jgi:hypothetical protein
MATQNGGLKLINPKKTDFQPIYDMITRGELQLLTYASLKGFIFTLTVSKTDSEYLTFSGTKFIKPVTSFILKLAVITPKNNTPLDDYKDRYKYSESTRSYIEEAQLQQQIWKSSIIGNKPEICPSVANFSLFDNNNSKKLLAFLQRQQTTEDTQDVFAYLSTQINKTNENEIGVIVMPNVENSTTFKDFLLKTSVSDVELINKAYAYVIAQIARLFIDIGVIHYDLHFENILIYLTSINTIKSVLIDFGKALDIQADITKTRLQIKKRLSIIALRKKLYNKIFDLTINTRDKKKEFILETLDYIASTYPPDRNQMDWWKDVRTNDAITEMAFDTLTQMFTNNDGGRTGLSKKRLTEYEKKGHFLNFNNKKPKDFYVSFPDLSQTIERETLIKTATPTSNKRSGVSTLRGGRKNQRKTRSNRRTLSLS